MLFAAIPLDSGLEQENREFLPLQFFRAALTTTIAANLQNDSAVRRAVKMSSHIPAARSYIQAAVIADSASAASHEGSLETLELVMTAARESAKVFGGQDVFDRLWNDVKVISYSNEFGPGLHSIPIWGDKTPDWIGAIETEVRKELLKEDPETWSFWLRWWDGVLSGNQLDWDLQRHVALIPNEIWEQGPAAVAEAIRQIEGLGRGKAHPGPRRTGSRHPAALLPRCGHALLGRRHPAP
jgi:hypothetical protein